MLELRASDRQPLPLAKIMNNQSQQHQEIRDELATQYPGIEIDNNTLELIAEYIDEHKISLDKALSTLIACGTTILFAQGVVQTMKRVWSGKKI